MINIKRITGVKLQYLKPFVSKQMSSKNKVTY